MRDMDWHGYRVLAWAAQGLLVIAIGVVLFQRQWLPAASLGGFLLASYLFVAFERKLPSLFDLIFVIAALINAGGWAWDLFNKPGPYDEITHFYTIFAITLAIGYMLYTELMAGINGRRALFVIMVASLGITIGSLWEVTEWVADFFVPKQIVSGLFDTVTDIILDSAGAFLAALLNLWGLHERSRISGRAASPSKGAPASARR
jgi:hypothetical protein